MRLGEPSVHRLLLPGPAAVVLVPDNWLCPKSRPTFLLGGNVHSPYHSQPQQNNELGSQIDLGCTSVSQDGFRFQLLLQGTSAPAGQMLLPSRFNDSEESSPHDGQKKKDKKNKKEKPEKRSKGKKKSKHDDEEEEGNDAEHVALGGGGDENDDDEDDDLFGDLEGLDDLVDEEGLDDGKKSKKRPATSKKERAPKKRPAKKRDDGVEALNWLSMYFKKWSYSHTALQKYYSNLNRTMLFVLQAEEQKPWQYMIEDAATYSTYRPWASIISDPVFMDSIEGSPRNIHISQMVQVARIGS